MKKKLLIIGGITLIIVIGIVMVIIFGKKEEEKVNEIMGKDISDVVKNETEEKQKNLEIKDIQIRSLGASIIVYGKVTNKDKKTTVNLELRIYNTDYLIGVADIDVKNLKKNETRDFEITIIGDYKNAENFKINVV